MFGRHFQFMSQGDTSLFRALPADHVAGLTISCKKKKDAPVRRTQAVINNIM